MKMTLLFSASAPGWGEWGGAPGPAGGLAWAGSHPGHCRYGGVQTYPPPINLKLFVNLSCCKTFQKRRRCKIIIFSIFFLTYSEEQRFFKLFFFIFGSVHHCTNLTCNFLFKVFIKIKIDPLTPYPRCSRRILSYPGHFDHMRKMCFVLWALLLHPNEKL